MAAARAWAAGNLFAATSPIEEPDALQDARLWGATPEEIDGVRAMLGQETVRIWPDNILTVAAFVTSGTQWRTGLDVVDGRLQQHWIGLDYGGARVSIEASGLVITPTLWTGLRIMENAAAAALNGVTVH